MVDWWALGSVGVGAAAVAGAVVSAPVTVPAAIGVGVLWTFGFGGIFFGGAKFAVSFSNPSLAEKLPGNYQEATVGLALNQSLHNRSLSNAIANLGTPVPEAAIPDTYRTVKMLVTVKKGYEDIVAKPRDFITVAQGVSKPATGESTPSGQVTLSVHASLTAPNGFTTYLVKPGDNLWSIWHEVKPPKASWQETLSVNGKILKDPSVLYPGDYILAPVSECLVGK